MDKDKIMDLGYQAARQGMNIGQGGPFGAVIVKDGEVIAVGNNRVLGDHDPTAHAEVMAIRIACQKLKTHDLSGCEIYSTCEPCPMCLSAIVWANIKTVYYEGTAEDAADIGFRDELIYQMLRGEKKVLHLVQLDPHKCQQLFAEYANGKKEIY